MTKISFAKTHKTGGSTLQNILLRYGFKHGHRIALPQKHWFFSLEDQFKADMVANFSWSKNRKFDIIASHRFVSCGLRIPSNSMKEIYKMKLDSMSFGMTLIKARKGTSQLN